MLRVEGFRALGSRVSGFIGLKPLRGSGLCSLLASRDGLGRNRELLFQYLTITSSIAAALLLPLLNVMLH